MNRSISNQAAEAGETENDSAWKTGYWSLFFTQSQGAFSDNVFKFLVIFLAMTLYPEEKDQDRLVPLIGAIFALPFILFSMAGGYWADRISKRKVVIHTKIAEILIMGLATYGLYSTNFPLLLAVVFLMSTQSAFFGPAKYGLLPEILPERLLSWGNGIYTLGTFGGIITGMVLAGWLFDTFQNQTISGMVLVGLAGIGFLTSRGITKVQAADPHKRFKVNFLGELYDQIRYASGDRPLILAMIGGNFFWFIGALMQTAVLIYGGQVLELTFFKASLFQATIAVGIGAGSFTAGYISDKKIEYGLIPLGAIGMCVCSFLLGINGLNAIVFAILLGSMGFFSGFYIVPVNALIQHRPDKSRKGSILATEAFLSFVAIFLSAGIYSLLKDALGLSIYQVFSAVGFMMLLATVFIVKLLPDSLIRLIGFMLTHTLYRVRVLGRKNIPEKGGALFVCNHLSFVDSLLVQSSTDRPIRFIMFKDYYDHPALNPWAKIMKAIPISSQSSPRDLIHSLKVASEAIRLGDVVCIFAEGQLTRNGQLLPFRRGFEKIMKGLDAPIIPVYLDRVWGSIFSFSEGKFFWKRPREIPYRMQVSYGKPMPPASTPFEVRCAVQELASDTWKARKAHTPDLGRSFVKMARKKRSAFFMADHKTEKLRFLESLTKALFLAKRLASDWNQKDKIGIFLPPSIGCTLVNLAALLAGRIPVNLNYTLSNHTLQYCLDQCGIQNVVTSRAFLEQAKLNPPGNLVFLEDKIQNPSWPEKIKALFLARLAPYSFIRKKLGAPSRFDPDDTATIIFSSGSTGIPKGVLLSHFNIQSNIEQLGQVVGFTNNDRILGILPPFHSFGFTGALALPACLGVGVVYHPTPLDAKGVGEKVKKYCVSFLLATPTFLQIYMRGCAPEQFGSLKWIAVGAEKLTDRLAQAFEDKFGIRPLEAYGCTECSPTVTINTRDFRAAGLRQVGAKRGSIGHPLPGVTVRITDIDSGEILPPNQAGLMWVKGPNVMKGYLNSPDKTKEVMDGEWYRTGDVARIDEDGFIVITDRLSRFSKIGGEMVPHVNIEDQLHAYIESSDPSFAVTGIPDEKKGEKLVVLHTLNESLAKECARKIQESNLPNLWKPKADDFYRVEGFPVLGTGKLDLKGIRDMALELAG